MRVRATDAERKLWSLLRGKQVAGLRFRRQQPFGPYIADFYCAAAKLVVELDGSQHGERKNLAHDMTRTKWLEARGMRVLRFANVDMLKQPEAVVDSIFHAIVSAGAGGPESAGPKLFAKDDDRNLVPLPEKFERNDNSERAKARRNALEFFDPPSRGG